MIVEPDLDLALVPIRGIAEPEEMVPASSLSSSSSRRPR
jgi:hypothetical protein